MKKLYLYIAAALLILASVIYYVFFRTKLIKVKEVTTQNIKVIKSVSADGEVKSHNSANLSFLSSGKILKVNVQEGDMVKTGQILAILDTSSQSQEVKAARDLRDIAMREKDAFVDKYKDGDARKDLGGDSQYNINIRKYDEEISKANAGYTQALLGLGNSYIKAPFNGTIVTLNKKAGENSTLSETIMTEADLSDMYYEVTVEQGDFGQIQTGQKAEIHLDAYDDQNINGEVIKLPSTVQTGKDTFKVELSIDQTNRNILFGMTGDARITVQQTDSEVPSLTFDEVFTEEDGRHFVWTINDENKLIKKYIKIGLEGDIDTEVTDNMDGIKIVVPADSATKDIKEGSMAQIVDK